MKYFVIVSFLIITSFGYTQNRAKDYDKKNNIATKKFNIGDFYGAIKIYTQLYQQDSLDKELNYYIGVCYYKLKKYDLAEKHFKKTSSSLNIEFYRYKGALAHIQQEFKKAINYYNAYKITSGEKDFNNEEINRLVEKIRYAESALKEKRDIIITNMGNKINTEYSEYVPLISADESMLFFTSRRPKTTGGLLDPNGRYFEDVYVSYKKNNFWEKPVQLDSVINTPTNDACVGLSPDGQILYIFRTNPNLISGDLYESRMGLYDWEEPKKLGSNINSDYVETSASITVDDKVLYFSSDREGGYGGKDIYRVIRLPNGKWSKAINLGPTINTKYDEDAPFIHSDGKTLYFSSKGHENMGGYDIFKSELEKRKWSTPQNLKSPINTVQDDIFFVLAANGKVGYYSSSQVGGYGEQDIYQVVLKDEMLKFHVLKGLISTNDKEVASQVKITLIENESKKVKGIYRPNEISGKFILLVNPENTYNIIIEAKGYYSITSDLNYDIKSDDLLNFTLEKKPNK